MTSGEIIISIALKTTQSFNHWGDKGKLFELHWYRGLSQGSTSNLPAFSFKQEVLAFDLLTSHARRGLLALAPNYL
jgi:hypothetical protein